VTKHSSFQQASLEHNAKPGSLAYALLGAAVLVDGVAQGKSLQHSLPALAQDWQLTPQDRGAIQAITFHTLRYWGGACAVRDYLLPKPPEPAILGALLEVALALAWPEDAPLYPSHTLVSQAVEAAKAAPELRAAQGLINAVLRRWQRERLAISAAALASPQAQFNHPTWWITKLKALYPNRYKEIAHINSSQAPMTLRVNVRQGTVQAYLQKLQEAQMQAYALSGDAIVLKQAVGVEKLPGFAEGAVSVQDFGAQLAAVWLDAQAGQRVLDACAAPGGKTAHILERADVQLLAIDSDAVRLQRVEQTLQRLCLSATLKHADAANTASWWDGVPFDRILLDAPCSASGVVRRHPDVLWLRRESDIAPLMRTQADLLAALWPLLKPGGRLLYCTCSVFPEEGEQQTTAFAANTPDARPLALDMSNIEGNLGHNLGGDNKTWQKLTAGVQLLPTGALMPASAPAQISHDGFYYALLEKKA
jgi:16S rRNA (cytosine967-C5)-methyltransferase